MSAKKPFDINQLHPKTLLLGVYAPDNPFREKEPYFEEFLSLVKTLDVKYDETLFIKVRMIDHVNFFTKGKLEEVQKFCTEKEFEEIILSEEMSPQQERNLSDILKCKITDRERLILEIFKRSAQTAEGKTQVEIAEMEYLNTRLTGHGTELAQQSGYIGGRGPGETQKEVMKRIYATKIRQAKKQLETLEKSKITQRKQRLESNIPLITLIGYTNAGKSSLLNLLTKSNVLAEDKLFATLDTTTRELYLTPQKKVLLSDTVGFISKLPHHLIEAFRSTLDELLYSDLLLIVVDLSMHIWKDQIRVVHKTLNELKIERPILYVFNKIDRLTKDEDGNYPAELTLHLKEFQPQVLTNTLSKEGVSDLVEYLKKCDFKKQKSS